MDYQIFALANCNCTMKPCRAGLCLRPCARVAVVQAHAALSVLQACPAVARVPQPATVLQACAAAARPTARRKLAASPVMCSPSYNLLLLAMPC